MTKHAKATSVIGGSDGPTSYIVLKKNKLTPRQKILIIISKLKRIYVEKTIKCGTHTIDEVVDYIVKNLGFVEKDLDADEIMEEQNQLRASFIIRYAPELLSEYAGNSQVKSESKEDVEAFFKYNEERMRRASEIPYTEFPIDFHKFTKEVEGTNSYMDIIIEKRFKYIGGGAVGSKKLIKSFNRIYKDLYRYYGVTEEDICVKSDRYKELLGVLSQ